jgi:hypothetical protein
MYQTLNRTIIIGLFCVGMLSLSQAQTTQQLKKRIDSLKQVHNTQLAKQQKINKKLIADKIQLEYSQAQAQRGKDSIQTLLNGARYRERVYKKEATRLKNLVGNTQSKMDSLTKAYDEVSIANRSTLIEYRKVIVEVTKERNKLAAEKAALQDKLNQLQGNFPDLFPFDIRALPCEYRRERLSAVSKAKKIEAIQMRYRFTRPPQVSDTVNVKVYNATGKLMATKVKLSTPWNTTQQEEYVLIDVTNKGWLPGRYVVRLYWSNHQKNVANRAVGLAEFTLR